MVSWIRGSWGSQLMGLARAPARLVLRLARLVRLALRHLARRHLSRRLVSANNTNVNVQHIKRGQPTATRMHVRATRASRALRQTCRARACDCQSRDSVQTGSKHAKVQATLRQSECIRACVCNVSITNEARRRSACAQRAYRACCTPAYTRAKRFVVSAWTRHIPVRLRCRPLSSLRGGVVECFFALQK